MYYTNGDKLHLSSTVPSMKITHKTPAHLYIAGFAIAFFTGFFGQAMSSELYSSLMGLSTIVLFPSSVWMCIVLLRK